MRRSVALAIVLTLAVVLVFVACQSGAPTPVPVAAGPLRVAPAAPGDVAPQVAALIEREAAARRQVVVYVGAPWCAPCKAFHEAAARGELDAALPGVTILEFDLDVDEARLEAAGYASKLVPLFARPRADGTYSGEHIEGARKGSDYVADLVPRLRALVGPPP